MIEAACTPGTVVVFCTRKHRTQRSATFFVIQVDELLEETEKCSLLFLIQRLEKAAAQETARWKKLF